MLVSFQHTANRSVDRQDLLSLNCVFAPIQGESFRECLRNWASMGGGPSAGIKTFVCSQYDY